MPKILLFIFILFQTVNIFSQSDYVSKIYYDIPTDLAEQELLVPAFDRISSLEGFSPKEKKRALLFNQQADEANENLREVLDRDYGFPYKLVSISQLKSTSGPKHKYYLDMVLMPRQWEKVNPNTLIPTFVRYKTANKMWILNNFQFHYYIYIRDLHTKEVYFTQKLHGNRNTYKSISLFLKQLKKDL